MSRLTRRGVRTSRLISFVSGSSLNRGELSLINTFQWNLSCEVVDYLCVCEERMSDGEKRESFISAKFIQSWNIHGLFFPIWFLNNFFNKYGDSVIKGWWWWWWCKWAGQHFCMFYFLHSDSILRWHPHLNYNTKPVVIDVVTGLVYFQFNQHWQKIVLKIQAACGSICPSHSKLNVNGIGILKLFSYVQFPPKQIDIARYLVDFVICRKSTEKLN